MPVFCLLGFSLLAILSLYFPELPGNGKGPMQLALSDGLPLSMVAVLLVLKMVVILAVLRGGAEGGLLTPGLAVGGLASLLLCALWQSGSLAEMKVVSLWWGQPRFSPLLCRCADRGGAGDGVHSHGSQLSGTHAAVRGRGVFDLPGTG